MHESDESPSISPLLTELEALEAKIAQVHLKVQDLKEAAQLDELPPDQWTDIQEQVAALEERMQSYLQSYLEEIEMSRVPTLFWQVVRFGGLGMVLGFALGKWLSQ